MENNQYIQEYLNNDNPTVQQTANAYYQRDLIMNISFEDAFKGSVNKLCISPEGIIKTIDYLFKLHINNYINNYLQNKNDINHEMYFNYNDFYNEHINTQRYINSVNKYNNLGHYYQNNDHLGFYLALNLVDLSVLGF